MNRLRDSKYHSHSNNAELVGIWNEMKRDKEKHLRMLREALEKEAGEQKLSQ